MIHLLDVNVLVALFDPGHVHHEAAHAWLEDARQDGWATCPITQNGLVRVLSNPAYPGRKTTVADAVDRLARFTGSGGHTFWSDDVSILDGALLTGEQLGGHREVTDAYLLVLAMEHGGALATFDRRVRTDALPGYEPDRLVVLRS